MAWEAADPSISAGQADGPRVCEIPGSVVVALLVTKRGSEGGEQKWEALDSVGAQEGREREMGRRACQESSLEGSS
jgi:hypothetical protein